MNFFSRPFGFLVENHKYHGTCEFYHIDRCVDPNCYQRTRFIYADVSSSTYMNSNTCRARFDSFTNTTLRTNVDDHSVAQRVKQDHEKYNRSWINLNEWKFRGNRIAKPKAYSSFRGSHLCRKELKSKYQSSVSKNTDDLNYIHEYTRPLYVYRSKSFIKPLYVTHRQMQTSDYESSQIGTSNLSPFDSVSNSLNAENNRIKNN